MSWKLINGNGNAAPQAKPLVFLVGSAADLMTDPPFEIPVGSIAYTAGLGNVWQLNEEGSWVKTKESIPIDPATSILVADVLPIINGYVS